MKIYATVLILALAFAGAADAAQRGGGHGGPNNGGGRDVAAPGPSAPSAPSPAPSGPNPGVEADTRGSATRAYVSDFCFNWKSGPWCKAR